MIQLSKFGRNDVPYFATITLADHLAQHVAAVLGVGADLLGPAPGLNGLGPLLADQHFGAFDLVDRGVAGLALGVGVTRWKS